MGKSTLRAENDLNLCSLNCRESKAGAVTAFVEAAAVLISRASSSNAPISPAVQIQLIRRACRSISGLVRAFARARSNPLRIIYAFTDIKRQRLSLSREIYIDAR